MEFGPILERNAHENGGDGASTVNAVTGPEESALPRGGALAPDATYSESNSTITLSSGSSNVVVGNNDTIVMTGNSSTSVAVEGTGETITGNSGSNIVGLASAGTSATVTGTGDVGLNASNVTLTETGTGAEVTTVANVSNADVNASGLVVLNAGSDFSGNIDGSNNNIELTSNSGSNIGIYGSGDSVSGVSGSNLVNVANANSTLNISGSGGTVGILASGDTITATGEYVNSVAGTASNEEIQSTINGNNDIVGFSKFDNITLGGTGDVVDLQAGTFGRVTGNNETINGGTGAFLGLSGNNDLLSGNSTTISMAGSNETLTINGSNNVILESAANSIVIAGGSNNTIILGTVTHIAQGTIGGNALGVTHNETVVVTGAENGFSDAAKFSETMVLADGSGAVAGYGLNTARLVGFVSAVASFGVIGSGAASSLSAASDTEKPVLSLAPSRRS